MKYDYDINLQADNSLSHILRRIKPNSKVLEFGPAKGYMTRILTEQMNCSVYCVEIDEEAARYAAEFASHLMVGDLDEMKWTTELSKYAPYDYIIFADVLEHLKYPDKVLQAAVSMLDDEGIVFTSIPNMAHAAVLLDLLQGNFTYRRVGLLDNTHLRFYTRKAIEALLQRGNLSPVEWITTMMLPEQTEIETNYEYVPAYIADYIREREDAHVYQFVTVSKKASSNTGGLSLEAMQGRLEYSRFMQVFWGNHFTENCSVKLGIDGARNDKVFRIHLPKEALGQTIRIDPTNFPSIIEISRMTLLDLHNQALQEWTGSAVQEQLVNVHQLYNVRSPQVSTAGWLANGSDPHWYFVLPPVSEQDSILEIHMRTMMIDGSFAGLISSALDDTGAYLHQLEQAHLELKQVRAEFDATHEQLRQQLETAMNDIRDLRTALSIEMDKWKLIVHSRLWKWARWINPKLKRVLDESDQGKGD